MVISFRPMLNSDIRLAADWQLTPEVRQRYGRENTGTEQIYAHYQKELEETPQRTRHYIIQLGGRAAGMIQTYLLSSYPDYSRYVSDGKEDAMTDIFLAPEFMHKGYGKYVMQAFLRDYVFSGKLFYADRCLIGPETKNTSAIRMYEKAGFKWLRTVQIPGEDESEYIMVIAKSEL